VKLCPNELLPLAAIQKGQDMNTATKTKLRILEVSASGRRADSVSRVLTADIIAALESRHGPADVTRRDLADGIGFVDEAWINANFTAEDERTAAQRDRLAESDALVAQMQQADIVVIGAPIYNFGVPASLKAWVDMIARARLTFRYTENGPEGLLHGKEAYVVVASGGVPVDSPVDFATPYLRQALGFVGITDVKVIAADQLNQKLDDSLDAARARIAELINTTGAYENRAA
jgi:FMN-dependent NADH-azoreductase